MNLKKVGIKLIIATVLMEILVNYLNLDGYLATALGVFGVGSGIVLIFLDGYRYFDR